MFEAYGRWLMRRRRWVAAAVAIVALISVGASVSLAGRMVFELFVVHDSEAWAGKQLMDREFGYGTPNLVVLVTAKNGDVSSPAAVGDGRAVAAELAREPGVSNVQSYWSDPEANGALRSTDGHQALVLARLAGDDETVLHRVRGLEPRIVGDTDAVQVKLGGYAEFMREGAISTNRDIAATEVVSGPITLVGLLLVFGSLVSALLPLLMAALAVLGTGSFLWVLSHFVAIQPYGLFMTSILALGLGLDYSLLIISRFREELARSDDVEAAVVATVATAGRTVSFSALALAAALSGLVAMPLVFVYSVGLAMIGTALVSGAMALTVLPVVLAWLGPNVNRWSFGRRARPLDGAGRWSRIARWVMRRSRLTILAVIAFSFLTGLPVLGIHPSVLDDRSYPKDFQVREVGDALRTNFADLPDSPIVVAVPRIPAGGRGPLDAYARRLAGIDGIRSVRTTVQGDAAYLELTSRYPPLSNHASAQIRAVRAVRSPVGETLVTGEAANIKDVTDAILHALPLAGMIIALASFVALAVQFGSLVLPLIAVAFTGLGLWAVLGMYVLVFQEGHLNRLLHITTTGNVYIVAPILIGNLAFGLALDYQVFILSRIREEYERSGDHTTAIARGLGFSGPIISAAALLIAMVFLGSGIMSSATVLKGVGFGLAVTVLFDAFVIRATLVPAVMHLLGTRVWWAPAWLSRLTERLGTAHAAPGPPVELARAHVPIKNGVLDGTADCALESSQSRGRS